MNDSSLGWRRIVCELRISRFKERDDPSVQEEVLRSRTLVIKQSMACVNTNAPSDIMPVVSRLCEKTCSLSNPRRVNLSQSSKPLAKLNGLGRIIQVNVDNR